MGNILFIFSQLFIVIIIPKWCVWRSKGARIKCERAESTVYNCLVCFVFGRSDGGNGEEVSAEVQEG